MFHVPAPSSSTIPTTLPRAATARATTTARKPTRTTATSFAIATRTRLGSRVKVTRPVRCDHSAVTARIPSTGSSRLCGVAVAPTKLMNVRSLGSATNRNTAMTATVMRPIAASSQKPARVSTSLRPSTRRRRLNGTAVTLGSGRVAWTAGVRSSCSCGDLLSCVVGGELEEHVFEPGAVGAPQLGDDDAVPGGRPSRSASRVASTTYAPSAQALVGEAGERRGSARAPRRRRRGPACPTASSRSALLPSATITPRPMTTRWSATTSISCSRCDDSRTVPPRSAKPLSSPRIQWMPAGSRPLAGSSRISTCGSPRRACAMPSRCRMPSE